MTTIRKYPNGNIVLEVRRQTQTVTVGVFGNITIKEDIGSDMFLLSDDKKRNELKMSCLAQIARRRFRNPLSEGCIMNYNTKTK